MVLSAKHSGGSTVVYPPASVLNDFSDSAMHRERFFFVAAAETPVCLPFFFFVAAAETATLRFFVAAACFLRFFVAGPSTAIVVALLLCGGTFNICCSRQVYHGIRGRCCRRGGNAPRIGCGALIPPDDRVCMRLAFGGMALDVLQVEQGGAGREVVATAAAA